MRILIFLGLLPFSSAQGAPALTPVLQLQRAFHSAAPQKHRFQSDLVMAIRTIEGRVSWLAVDAEYVKQDAQWSYQHFVQFLSGRGDPYSVWRAERLALQAAEQAKVVAEKIRKDADEVGRLTGAAKPDAMAAQEAQYLLESASQAALQAVGAREASSNLYVLTVRYREAAGQRLIWAAEILERETAVLNADAKALEDAIRALQQKLKR